MSQEKAPTFAEEPELLHVADTRQLKRSPLHNALRTYFEAYTGLTAPRVELADIVLEQSEHQYMTPQKEDI